MTISNKSKGSLKDIKTPRKSSKLAEFIGIVLGDGNIHHYQRGKKVGTYMVRIAGDSNRDNQYLRGYVANLMEELFELKAKFYKQKNANELMVIVHSRKLVDYCTRMGLKPGNKIANQTTIPEWIWEKKSFLRAVIRGLMDTDGSIYELKSHWPGLFQIVFDNRNLTLVKDLHRAFASLGFIASKVTYIKPNKSYRVYLTRKDQIRKYYKDIGFSNPRKQAVLTRMTAP